MAAPPPAASGGGEKRERKDDVFTLPVHAKNVAMFRRILEVVLPVAYDDHFYEQSSTGAWAEFSRLLYYKDIPVGVAGGRLEGDPAPGGGGRRLYVTVLAVLAAYRGRGLGARLLGELADAAAARGDVAEVYAHVHVASDARAFYARAGFAPDAAPVLGYYAAHRHVPPPPDALVFRKAVAPAARGDAKGAAEAGGADAGAKAAA